MQSWTIVFYHNRSWEPYVLHYGKFLKARRLSFLAVRTMEFKTHVISNELAAYGNLFQYQNDHYFKTSKLPVDASNFQDTVKSYCHVLD